MRIGNQKRERKRKERKGNRTGQDKKGKEIGKRKD